MFERIKNIFRKPSFDGCLWDWAKATDFLMTDALVESLPTLDKLDTLRYYYNQANQSWSTKSCTIFWAIWALSDWMNYEFSLSQIKEIDEYSYTTNKYNKNAPRTRGQGWYVGFAVDLVRNRWNDQPELVAKYWKVMSYQIDMKDDDVVNEVIKKNYNIVTGYYGNAKYNADYQTDCILDWISFGTSTYWHCQNVIYTNWSPAVKDNYFGKKYNLYILKHMPSQITCWHNCWYIFVKVEDRDAEELKKQNKMKTLLETVIPLNSEMWKTVSDEKFKKQLNEMNNSNRAKLKTAEEIIAKLSK